MLALVRGSEGGRTTTCCQHHLLRLKSRWLSGCKEPPQVEDFQSQSTFSSSDQDFAKEAGKLQNFPEPFLQGQAPQRLTAPSQPGPTPTSQVRLGEIAKFPRILSPGSSKMQFPWTPGSLFTYAAFSWFTVQQVLTVHTQVHTQIHTDTAPSPGPTLSQAGAMWTQM